MTKITLILFITFFTFIAAAQQNINKLNCLQELLNTLEVQNNFNGAVLVAKEGQIIFNTNVGYSFKNKGALIINSSTFELGSMSKTFTALALHILEENGKINLNSPITDHFPKLPYNNVTVNALLNHTSGLYDVYEEKELREKYFAFYNNVNAPYSNQDYFDFIAKYKPPLLWQPNEKHKYSNTGYVILGLLIERISGQSYFDFITENILKPANMKHTYLIKELKNERIPSLVYGYSKNKAGEILRNPDPSAPPKMRGLTYGDDDMISTVDDMLKYDQAIRNGVFFNQSKMEEIFKPVLLNDGSKSHYARGFRIIEEGQNRRVDHTGSTSGYYAYSKFSTPDSDYSIVLFINVTMGGEHFRKLQNDIISIMEN